MPNPAGHPRHFSPPSPGDVGSGVEVIGTEHDSRFVVRYRHRAKFVGEYGLLKPNQGEAIFEGVNIHTVDEQGVTTSLVQSLDLRVIHDMCRHGMHMPKSTQHGAGLRRALGGGTDRLLQRICLSRYVAWQAQDNVQRNQF